MGSELWRGGGKINTNGSSRDSKHKESNPLGSSSFLSPFPSFPPSRLRSRSLAVVHNGFAAQLRPLLSLLDRKTEGKNSDGEGREGGGTGAGRKTDQDDEEGKEGRGEGGKEGKREG